LMLAMGMLETSIRLRQLACIACLT
jgi:hypothetical protein